MEKSWSQPVARLSNVILEAGTIAARIGSSTAGDPAGRKRERTHKHYKDPGWIYRAISSGEAPRLGS